MKYSIVNSEHASIGDLDVPPAIEDAFVLGARDVLVGFSASLRKGTLTRGQKAVPLTVEASDDPAHPVGKVFASTSAASRALGFTYNRCALAFSSSGGSTIKVAGVTLKK